MLVQLNVRFVVLPSIVLACSVSDQLTILAERREAVTMLVYFKAWAVSLSSTMQKLKPYAGRLGFLPSQPTESHTYNVQGAHTTKNVSLDTFPSLADHIIFLDLNHDVHIAAITGARIIHIRLPPWIRYARPSTRSLAIDLARTHRLEYASVGYPAGRRVIFASIAANAVGVFSVVSLSFTHPLSVRTFYRTNTPPLPRHRITVHTTRQTPPSFNALPLFNPIGKRRWHCQRLFLVPACVGFTCCAILIRPFLNSFAVSRPMERE
ncbi:hypothetical protein MVEN_00907700 [Mycena venus]|uniref:Uncharacterized protein n=1 Tax=Mycena venus TaxID=2733690 RepID=A0A8H7D1M7_9AGAR|nr:hypothetical protein MVEN_00907700 [Mycena venus]